MFDNVPYRNLQIIDDHCLTSRSTYTDGRCKWSKGCLVRENSRKKETYSHSGDSEPLNIKGFYLGMEKTEVKTFYQKLKSDAVAQYINIILKTLFTPFP